MVKDKARKIEEETRDRKKFELLPYWTDCPVKVL
jgi:hypothetical protein